MRIQPCKSSPNKYCIKWSNWQRSFHWTSFMVWWYLGLVSQNHCYRSNDLRCNSCDYKSARRVQRIRIKQTVNGQDWNRSKNCLKSRCPATVRVADERNCQWLTEQRHWSSYPIWPIQAISSYGFNDCHSVHLCDDNLLHRRRDWWLCEYDKNIDYVHALDLSFRNHDHDGGAIEPYFHNQCFGFGSRNLQQFLWQHHWRMALNCLCFDLFRKALQMRYNHRNNIHHVSHGKSNLHIYKDDVILAMQQQRSKWSWYSHFNLDVGCIGLFLIQA